MIDELMGIENKLKYIRKQLLELKENIGNITYNDRNIFFKNGFILHFKLLTTKMNA